MKINLFEDFPKHSKEDWMVHIIRDLKGKDYEKTLTSLTEDGIKIEPIYTKQDGQGLDVLDYYHNRVHQASSILGLPPRIWSNVSAFEGPDEKTTNAEILDALLNGADALMLQLTGDENLEVLLKEVNPKYIEIFLSSKGDPVKVLQMFVKWINDNNWETNSIRGGLLWEGFGSVLTQGIGKETITETAIALMQLGEDLPRFRVFSIGAATYHDSGASLVQELGYAFSSWIDLIEVMVDQGFYPQEIIQKSMLRTCVGGDFFLEIAKVKAARIMMHKIIKLYQIDIPAEDLFIFAQTSLWTKTKLDIETNMVRNTTEAMAAILGGANAMYVLPHDIASGNSTSLANRMARNVSNILKEESYLDKILDPVAGTYYVENLIVEILQKVKTFMESIENNGGWWSCFESEFIQNSVKASRNRKMEEILEKKRTKIGVNKYLSQKKSIFNSGEFPMEESWQLLPFRDSMSVENQKSQNP
ncbi:methylmalonyl-CoA mutase family protein [Aquiflexum sp. TKW24L]|uniref:methylmalonyl-CoA mutase family protein n=1 Tax=Aquiflexum sp. TKW24L TaxID=2942212 RepID=UPI0020BE0F4F|nr:methylmalonyl-CoA mutase family protein [Aquiflexum sp. TKW24L]MCL6259486.1 methylmalonyl-CoA mutase family protein [Aquiflexum sp. TKW24L]